MNKKLKGKVVWLLITQSSARVHEINEQKTFIGQHIAFND